jgi:glycosyltransferase involved in cell wall biosynthesis
LGVVHNGLSMSHYPFSNEHDGYLLYVGRICKEKGTRFAVALARQLNLPLIIAAKVEETEAGHRYFRKYVKPYLNEKIRWIGEVDEVERNKLMSRAMAFLHPVQWREPFGLTLIEAMACGTPVIAFGLGSIPEIIEHKRTGFVVDTYEQMVETMRLIPTIDRAYTRAYVLSRFTGENMTDNYEKLYRQVAIKKIAAPTSASTPTYLSRKLLK